MIIAMKQDRKERSLKLRTDKPLLLNEFVVQCAVNVTITTNVAVFLSLLS